MPERILRMIGAMNELGGMNELYMIGFSGTLYKFDLEEGSIEPYTHSYPICQFGPLNKMMEQIDHFLIIDSNMELYEYGRIIGGYIRSILFTYNELEDKVRVMPNTEHIIDKLLKLTHGYLTFSGNFYKIERTDYMGPIIRIGKGVPAYLLTTTKDAFEYKQTRTDMFKFIHKDVKSSFTPLMII
jgi:hypothetical protein